MLFIILIAASSCYFFLLTGISVGLFLLPGRKEEPSYEGISVIVAARNEEAHIKNLIESVVSQEYPADKYELIVVSDRSTDSTDRIVRQYKANNIRLLRIDGDSIEEGGKKRALALGIEKARYDILAFTDADCVPDRDWLYELDCHFGKEVDFVAGYSPLLSGKETFLVNLKNFERISMFAVCAGRLGWNYGMTCTGRNMAYRKSLYEMADGFTGIENIPSGDDDLMLQRMTPFARKMNFMFTPDSCIPSYEDKDLATQLDQETRRASKWKYYPALIKVITAGVFLYYIAILAIILGFVFQAVPLNIIAFVLISKILGELVLIGLFCIRMRKLRYLSYFPIAELIYIPYYIFFGLKGSLGRYKWRG